MTVLAVPFVSQIDPVSGSGQANCGSACLAMCLAYRGIIAPTRGAMLYIADITRDGLPNDIGQFSGTYVTFTQLVACAAWFDVACRWFASWSEIQQSLDIGEPVILLVDNTALRPRQYPLGGGFDGHHFIVLTGVDGDSFMVNDPLSVYAKGPAPYTGASLRAGTALVQGVGAIAFAPLALVPQEDNVTEVADLQTRLAALEGYASALRDQLAALREEVATRTEERDDARTSVDAGVSTIASLKEDVEKPLRAEVLALKQSVAPLEARVAEMEIQLRAAVALAGRATAQRPPRVELQYIDGSLGYIPEA